MQRINVSLEYVGQVFERMEISNRIVGLVQGILVLPSVKHMYNR